MTSAALRALEAVVFAQRHRYFLWVPVWLGCGIGGYFSLIRELDLWECIAVFGGSAGLFAIVVMWRATLRVLLWPVILVGLGLLLAQSRAHFVAAPKFDYRSYGPVEGNIVHIDRSGSDRLRVTLSDLYIVGRDADRTPRKVRISFHGGAGTALEAGARIGVTAHLSPPQGPVEPGGFDFQRKAWFDRLGAVGYARAPPVRIANPDPDTFRARVFATRMALSQMIRDRMPGQSGAFAAAILFGDRSEIDPDRLTDLRRSNLAHLLAISGLHMGLLTGIVFAAVRSGMAFFPTLALRWPIKKIAALAALIAALGYLFLSGASVATQRAFVMVAVMLIAVLLDRPALSLRAVALAAVVILLVRPESLTEPGFQMSFAATTALVAVFERLARSELWLRLGRTRVAFVRNAAALFVASSVAGLATAPFSAFYFNQIAHFGLIANLASLPVMGAIVMPAALVGLVLMPLGLDGPAFRVMGWGIDWILAVANRIGGFEEAVTRVPVVDTSVLALLVLSVLFLVLWAGRARWMGLGPAVAALVLWTGADRPDILIDQTGRLVGFMEAKGRVLSRNKGAGFAARNWLENDGDGRSQEASFSAIGVQADAWLKDHNGLVVGYHWDKDPPDFNRLCALADLVILPQLDQAPCQAITRKDLAHGGAIAVWVGPDHWTKVSVRDVAGRRLWNQGAVDR